MKIMSRGLALGLALGVTPIAVLVAQAARDGSWGMTAESRERLQDGKLAAAKTALRLSADQEKLWAPVEEQVRASYKARAEKRAERQKRRDERNAARDKAGDAKSPRKRANIAERYERMAQRLTARAENMKAFASAFTPFYASLTDEQKAVVGPLMRDLRIAGMGRGHRHGRHRWHDGGWGERWSGKHWGQDRDRGSDAPKPPAGPQPESGDSQKL